jgi:hypothetical protein
LKPDKRQDQGKNNRQEYQHYAGTIFHHLLGV